MKCYLTGSEGFIGKNILEQLKYDFTAPPHEELDLLDGQAVADFFKDKHFDVIIHCANVGGRNPNEGEDIFYQNINMFDNLLKNKSHFDKLINLGSGAEYGKQEPIVNVDEDFERIPEDYYGMAKQVIGRTIEKINNGINLRCFGVWGKYEAEDRFITSLIKDKHVSVNNCKFSYCYIDDLVKIIDWFINNKSKHKTYNVGGIKIELKDIVKRFDKVVGITEYGIDYTCNDSRLRKELKFKYSDFNECLKKYQLELSVQAK